MQVHQLAQGNPLWISHCNQATWDLFSLLLSHSASNLTCAVNCLFLEVLFSARKVILMDSVNFPTYHMLSGALELGWHLLRLIPDSVTGVGPFIPISSRHWSQASPRGSSSLVKAVPCGKGQLSGSSSVSWRQPICLPAGWWKCHAAERGIQRAVPKCDGKIRGVTGGINVFIFKTRFPTLKEWTLILFPYT